MSGEFSADAGGGGLDGGSAGAGDAGGGAGSYAGFNGSGDALPSSTGSASASGGHPAAREQQSAPQQPDDGPPGSWAKDAAGHWHRIPQELRSYIRERERQSHERISELGQTASAHKEIAAAFEKYGVHQLPKGLSHAGVVEHLLAAGQALKANPGAVIAHLARANNVDLAQLIGFGGNAPKMLETLGRRAEQAERTVAALQQENEALKRQQAEGLDRQRDAEKQRRAENARQVAEARRQASINQTSGRGGVPRKGTVRESLERHVDRLWRG